MVGAGVTDFAPLVQANIKVPKSGYVYIWVSNDSEVPVYFDDLAINHIAGPLLQEDDYYPFGLEMKMLGSKAAGKQENKKKFTSQELDDDLGLNWYQFAFRSMDLQTGRFIQIDPISDKYVYNSTYAYAENRVINSIDLEGLEAKLAIAGTGNNTSYKQEDIESFNYRAKRLERIAGFLASQANNGDQIMNQMREATSSQGSIASVVIFAHASNVGIYLDNNDGFYRGGSSFTDAKNPGSNSANVWELRNAIKTGDIKFEKDAFIALGGCNCAKPDILAPLSLSITNETGVTTYGATSSVVPEIVNGKETGRLIASGTGTFIKSEMITETVKKEFKIFGLKFSVGIPQTSVKQTNVGNTIDPANPPK